jgi:hypothetical protein
MIKDVLTRTSPSNPEKLIIDALTSVPAPQGKNPPHPLCEA